MSNKSLPHLLHILDKAMNYKAEYKQRPPESDLKTKGKPVKASEDRSDGLTVGCLVENTLFKKCLFLEALIC